MPQLLKVSILNGIVMGGGAGCSIHGRYRIVTENSVCFFLLSILNCSSNFFNIIENCVNQKKGTKLFHELLFLSIPLFWMGQKTAFLIELNLTRRNI